MITFTVKANLDPVVDGIVKRFDDGSRGLEFISERVWAYATDYMPFLTGHNLYPQSWSATKGRLRHGELIYTLKTKGGFDAAWNLWRGHNESGTPFNYTQIEGHGNAGAFWVDRSNNDNMMSILRDIQNAIDSGLI
jgi:hypothetical protein